MDLDAIRRAQAAKESARRKRPAGTSADGAAFSRALDAAAGDSVLPPDTDIAGLLGQIDDNARDLAERQTPDTLIAYKQSVKKFLEEFLARSHSKQRITNMDPRAPHDYVLLVRNVDAKLEELSRQFVSQEGSQLQLLSLLDEIRGILMDLVV